MIVSSEKSVNYSIEASGYLNEGHQLSVVPVSNVTLTSGETDIELTAAVSQKKVVFSSEDMEAYDFVETTGTISPVTRSDAGDMEEVTGEFEGNLIFTISVDEV